MKSEQKLIDWLTKTLPPGKAKTGIGDDAAVISFGRQRDMVLTADAIVEGVDFTKSLPPGKVGRKALAVNLSDLAAMGASPAWFLVVIGVPKKVPELWVRKCYQGITRLAKRYDVPCLGGDITASRDIFLSITAGGYVPKGKAVLRRKAKAGDRIGVTGRLGGSILRHHYDFTPRIREGFFLSGYASAMIDISDGLARDLERLLSASRLRGRIELSRIPLSRDALRLAEKNSSGALERGLADGEDFELLVTVPEKKTSRVDRLWKKRFPGVPLSWIGRVEKGKPEIVWTERGKEDVLLNLARKGYDHFA